VLSAAPKIPPLQAVLSNPGVQVSTAAVFAAFDDTDPAAPTPIVAPPDLTDFDALIAFLSSTRNDLEPAAVRVAPVVGEALELTARGGEAELIRMSGSGATVFGLCRSAAAAQSLAARMAVLRPEWWIAPCVLG
jgi:4-diphosphocytidyl-2-C-methyl-D-erythritol kinase